MEQFEVSADERSDFERIREQISGKLEIELQATRYQATYGPAVELIELRSSVLHTKYARDRGLWVNHFAQDVRAGLFDVAL